MVSTPPRFAPKLSPVSRRCLQVHAGLDVQPARTADAVENIAMSKDYGALRAHRKKIRRRLIELNLR
jgi:hypothetical protein